MHLEIDNRKCSESSGECFSNTDEVASFIAAAHIKANLPYPLVSVNSSKLFIAYCKFKMQTMRSVELYCLPCSKVKILNGVKATLPTLFFRSRLHTRYPGDTYFTIPGGSVCGYFTAYPGDGNASSQEEA